MLKGLKEACFPFVSIVGLRIYSNTQKKNIRKMKKNAENTTDYTFLNNRIGTFSIFHRLGLICLIPQVSLGDIPYCILHLQQLRSVRISKEELILDGGKLTNQQISVHVALYRFFTKTKERLISYFFTFFISYVFVLITKLFTARKLLKQVSLGLGL